MNSSTKNRDYEGSFVDWGNAISDDYTWFTPSKDEWDYLINTRTVNGGTGNDKSYSFFKYVNGKRGVVIYPDDYTGAAYSDKNWATFEAAGCVFLPAADDRAGANVHKSNTTAYYWTSTSSDTWYAYSLSFVTNKAEIKPKHYRANGYSVRLVREVK